MLNVGINGFGRIGRMVFRRILKDQSKVIIAINSSYSPLTLAHLIKYDTVHGKLDVEIETKDDEIVINGVTIKVLNERDPKNIPWNKYGVELVVEATGVFRTIESAGAHINSGGAKKVVVTAPSKDDMKMIVMGVNERTYENDAIVSNASCTTNALAPLLNVLESSYGINSGLVTTVHSYTNDQKILDNPHNDLRRSRAAGLNMIPTTTGAASAIGKIIPTLSGKLDGVSVRVPTPNVSLLDVVVDLKIETTKEEVNKVFQNESKKNNGVIGFNELPLVSCDYIGNSNSVIVDGLSTMLICGKKLKLLGWYDNEWGYSCRIVDLINYISNQNNG
ncbi:type I glyceraldehyde-3-phosphate dehydrogenase [Pseudalkalibacillus sp. Hm43]|uniref:type I glyceraldehyde-3-phosphate dehydrogenase n=1 Tax=Pseudalkalibacillus sp. Hm43 TaxID=3450742 RepID=UPI003F44353C